MHYYAREFFSPVLLSVLEKDDNINLFVVNDGEGIEHVELELKLINFDGEVLSTKKLDTAVQANSSSQVYSLVTSELMEGADPSSVMLRSAVSVDGKTISCSDHTFVRPKELALPDQDIGFEYKKEYDQHIIYLEARSFVYKVHIRCTNDSGIFTRNFFNMVPGDFVKIEYHPSDDFMKNENTESLDFKFNSLYRLVN